MRFWDTSAIAPLLARETWSERLLDLIRSDAEIVAWWGSRVECVSAIRRRQREGDLDSAGAGQALGLLDSLAGSWAEVLPGAALRAEAERALGVHPLRAPDAFQLAAVLTWRRGPTRTAELVCLDERLRDAAAREGFEVLPPALDG